MLEPPEEAGGGVPTTNGAVGVGVGVGVGGVGVGLGVGVGVGVGGTYSKAPMLGAVEERVTPR